MPVFDPNFAIYPQVTTAIPILGRRVDGYFSEEHRLDLDTTEYPIESGGVLTDNAVKRRDRLRLQGMTSDLLPAPGNEATPERSAEAWSAIRTLFRDRTPVEVVTALHRYRNMIVVRCVAPVDRTTGRALKFTVDLVEVLFTETELTRFGPTTVDPTGPAADRTSTVDAGDKSSPTRTFTLRTA